MSEPTVQPQEDKMKHYAMISMVAGIVSVFFALISFIIPVLPAILGLVAGIIAIIFHKKRKETAQAKEATQLKIGLICGWIGTGLNALILIGLVFVFISTILFFF